MNTNTCTIRHLPKASQIFSKSHLRFFRAHLVKPLLDQITVWSKPALKPNLLHAFSTVILCDLAALLYLKVSFLAR
jgi:hypothetical protein